MGALSIRGVSARVEWAYHIAATIDSYTVTRDDTGVWRLSATTVQADAFKLTQRPLIFVAPYQGGNWRWPITSLTTDARQVRAVLAEPLKMEGSHVRADAPARARQT